MLACKAALVLWQLARCQSATEILAPWNHRRGFTKPLSRSPTVLRVATTCAVPFQRFSDVEPDSWLGFMDDQSQNVCDMHLWSWYFRSSEPPPPCTYVCSMEQPGEGDFDLPTQLTTAVKWCKAHLIMLWAREKIWSSVCVFFLGFPF